MNASMRSRLRALSAGRRRGLPAAAQDQRALWAPLRRRWYVYLPLLRSACGRRAALPVLQLDPSLPYSVVWLDRTPRSRAAISSSIASTATS